MDMMHNRTQELKSLIEKVENIEKEVGGKEKKINQLKRTGHWSY